jgi:hypothetical protein
MICGSCKGSHETVAQVKLCYHRQGGVTTAERPAPQEQAPLWGWNGKPSVAKREQSRAGQLAEINHLGLTVPAGVYALRNSDGAENNISYYVVDRPEKGKWAGKTFIKQQISDSEVKLPFAQQLAAIRRIASDPQGAMALYGHTIGRCGNCGRTLTNEESRNAGIGPVCRMKNGWD